MKLKTNFELTKEFVTNLKKTIERKDNSVALEIMESLHAADIAEIYDELSIEEAKYLYLLLDGEKAADVLVELEEDDRERFLKVLPSEVIAKQFINEMDSDDAADIIGELSEEKQEEVLSHIDDLEQAGDIVDLLHYDEDTAGGLMAKELICVNINWNITTCISEMRKQAEDVDELYYVYVVDNDDILKGTLSLKKMLLSSDTKNISAIYNKDVITVKTEATSEEVANIMDKYDLIVLPVVDSIGRLVGRITIDDVVDVIREEAEKDYQMVSGITQDVESSDSTWKLTKARLPWLLIGLFGGIFGARIIGFFEDDLDKYIGLALFFPLIGAMAGNVGVQSSSIIVQGIANNTIGLESIGRKLIKELLIALINGIILSSLIFIYSYFFSSNFALTVSVSTALFAIILFAGIFGTFIPLFLNKLKIDPALATGPFITTINDITGLVIYLFIGRMFFNFL
ncbi:MAG: magnesium transporter [Bacteroidetes bacterium]|jgi:magnesium transporter|nr:magnesium transporter [Bacteroidota bacterium]MBT6686275.1 magnesium transporter [Bacteroidota bacterium]MBT7142631.1 magnesium transporter [Bacteroidota bacterium]MBT7492783.1 magnesium transporter [Bacteroidota bacterium]